MKQGTGIIVEDYNGKILLHLRDGNTKILTNQWSFLGGNTDEGENLETCAKREVKEETNLDIDNLKFLTKYPFYDIENNVFHATTDSRQQEMKLGEGKELRWFTKQEAKKLIENLDYTNQNLQAILKFIKKKQKQP
ncbi:NUDIX hydrolase [bacterium]|nr:NUDIX hydrolase [bacterium]